MAAGLLGGQIEARIAADYDLPRGRALVAVLRDADCHSFQWPAHVALSRDAESLARAAGQRAGTEKFLKAQNDAGQLQASAKADVLRTQHRQLRERIDRLIVDNDRYRRARQSWAEA
ncbi:hypothetical protein [Paraburkholderia hospita]|uniref:hypothetical protein n=1 Tax=Paraburkholderia hospita TaxID=169430 RepID=UPI000DEEA8BE|nr:hypothetical protein [Paraburkholderia hospita]AXF05708.1 hypothetical protein CUJ88_45475 [Paraburkholderia hospita]